MKLFRSPRVRFLLGVGLAFVLLVVFTLAWVQRTERRQQLEIPLNWARLAPYPIDGPRPPVLDRRRYVLSLVPRFVLGPGRRRRELVAGFTGHERSDSRRALTRSAALRDQAGRRCPACGGHSGRQDRACQHLCLLELTAPELALQWSEVGWPGSVPRPRRPSASAGPLASGAEDRPRPPRSVEQILETSAGDEGEG